MRNFTKKLATLLIASSLMSPYAYAESYFHFLADNIDGHKVPIIENKVGIKPSSHFKFADLNLPRQELHPDVLFGFLLAELSRQRGYIAISVDSYYEIAKRTRDPRLARRATEMAIRAGMSKHIYESARLWLETEPTSTQARQTLAAILVGQQRLDEAKLYLQDLLVGDADKIKRAFLNFNTLFARQKDKEAVYKVVDFLAKNHLDKPEAHFAIAQSAINAKHFDIAKTSLEESLKLSPRWEQAVGLLGQVMNELDRIAIEKAGTPMTKVEQQPAIILYKSYLEKYPESKEVRTYYARLLTLNKEYDQAKDQFQLLAKEHPNNPEMLLVIGLLALQAKHYDQADTYLNQALQFQKGENEKNMIRSYLGQSYEDQKNYDKAIETYSLIKTGEYAIPSTVRIAIIKATKQNKLEDAIAYLHKLQAESRQRNDLEQTGELIALEASLLRDANRPQDAFNLLTQGLKRIPNHATLLYDRAMISEKLNHIDQTEKDLKLLIKLQPNHAHAYNALGFTLLERTKRHKEAKQYLDKALSLSPNDAFILDSVGWWYFKNNDFAKALPYLERAYNERSDNDIGSHLVECYIKLQNMPMAEKLIKKLLADYPKDKNLNDLNKKYFSK